MNRNTDGTIGVLVAEDMQLLREAITGLLALEPDMRVVAEVPDGGLVVEAALAHRPEVAIIDIGLPGVDGITASERLREAVPDCRVLILTGLDGPGHIRRALRARVSGFLPKDVGAAELTAAVRTVARGGQVIDPELALAAMDAAPCPLTQRETEVLRMSATGSPVEEIAEQLFLSYGTVRNYLTAAVSKLGARNRIDAIRIATHAGWI